MKKLYKATYHSVFYTDDDPWTFARLLTGETSPFGFDENPPEEILCEDDIPMGWDRMHYPVDSPEGGFGSSRIDGILASQKETLEMKKRIIELESELALLRADLPRIGK